jgi:hypothetical protein
MIEGGEAMLTCSNILDLPIKDTVIAIEVRM